MKENETTNRSQSTNGNQNQVFIEQSDMLMQTATIFHINTGSIILNC